MCVSIVLYGDPARALRRPKPIARPDGTCGILGAMTLPSGTRLGSYELTAAIGAGGMGEVYRAKDARLGREAAIKVLPADLAGDAERRARFEQEARAASALNHPNILTVYDIGDSESGLYIAMEYVEGRTLRELLVSGPVPTRKLLPIATQVADGLAKAHVAGIVHRDLKPENVMVNKDGFVKILDFGLAKLAAPAGDGGSELATMVGPGTSPGVVLGTVGYMSPEQASGQAVDFRSDQFSLGAILYEMATGRRAFQKKTAVETLSAIIREDPAPIAGVNPAAPAPLRWIVERCLAKEPEDRYASTRDLARDLKQTQERLSDPTGEAPVLGAPRPGRRRWWAAMLAALALLAAADLALRLRPRAVAPATTPSLKRLTFGPGLEDEPSFSPDGKFLAYTSDERGNLDIVVQSLSGGEPIRIGDGDADDGEAAWSPDGSKLAFVSARDHGGRLGIALNVGPLEPYLNAKFGDIFLVPALGGTPAKLVEDGYFPSWSPDGKRIVFMSNRDRQLNLWTVSADGGAPARLTKEHGHRLPAGLVAGREVDRLRVGRSLDELRDSCRCCLRRDAAHSHNGLRVRDAARLVCRREGHFLFRRARRNPERLAGPVHGGWKTGDVRALDARPGTGHRCGLESRRQEARFCGRSQRLEHLGIDRRHGTVARGHLGRQPARLPAALSRRKDASRERGPNRRAERLDRGSPGQVPFAADCGRRRRAVGALVSRRAMDPLLAGREAGRPDPLAAPDREHERGRHGRAGIRPRIVPGREVDCHGTCGGSGRDLCLRRRKENGEARDVRQG